MECLNTKDKPSKEDKINEVASSFRWISSDLASMAERLVKLSKDAKELKIDVSISDETIKMLSDLSDLLANKERSIRKTNLMNQLGIKKSPTETEVEIVTSKSAKPIKVEMSGFKKSDLVRKIFGRK